MVRPRPRANWLPHGDTLQQPRRLFLAIIHHSRHCPATPCAVGMAPIRLPATRPTLPHHLPLTPNAFRPKACYLGQLGLYVTAISDKPSAKDRTRQSNYRPFDMQGQRQHRETIFIGGMQSPTWHLPIRAFQTYPQRNKKLPAVYRRD